MVPIIYMHLYFLNGELPTATANCKVYKSHLKNIPKDTCNYIKKKNINGTDLLDLQEHDIHSWEIPLSSKLELIMLINNIKRNQQEMLINNLNSAAKPTNPKSNRRSRIINFFKPDMPFSYLHSPDKLKKVYTKFDSDEETLEMCDVKATNNLTDVKKMAEKTNNQEQDNLIENVCVFNPETGLSQYQQYPGYQNVFRTLWDSSLPHKYDYIKPIPPKRWLLNKKRNQSGPQAVDSDTMGYLLPTDKRDTYIEISGGPSSSGAIAEEVPKVRLTINRSSTPNTNNDEKKKEICSCTLYVHLICYSIFTIIIVCFFLFYYL